MKAPGTAYDDDVLGKDPQPDSMDSYVRTSADNGGVHINSGIPNRAFYLVARTLGGNAWEAPGADLVRHPHGRLTAPHGHVQRLCQGDGGICRGAVRCRFRGA